MSDDDKANLIMIGILGTLNLIVQEIKSLMDLVTLKEILMKKGFDWQKFLKDIDKLDHVWMG